MRVLLVEDHTIVRKGLRSLLETLPGVKVIGEASTGLEALDLVSELKPEVVLMDISLSGLNGLEATRRIKKLAPQCKVLILSMHADENYVIQSLEAGASGYLVKDASFSELQLALEATFEGRTFLSPQVSGQVMERLLNPKNRRESQDLTPRQREVLQLIAEGHSTKEIARLLHLSPKTVETHRAHLCEKLEVKDLAGLIKAAIRLGLVEKP